MHPMKIFRVLMLGLVWSAIFLLIYTYIAAKPLLKKVFAFDQFQQNTKIGSQSDVTKSFDNFRNKLFPAEEFPPVMFVKTKHPEMTNTSKRILLWDDVYWFQRSEVKSNLCGLCTMTKNRSLIYDKDTAAVVINAWSKTPLNPPIDRRRRRDQLYVFWATESPGRTRFHGRYEIDLNLYPPHYFNATMSYRRDSTFYQPIHRLDVVKMVRNSWNEVEKKTKKLLAGKNRTALMLVSNCEHGSFAEGRLKLAQEMVDLGFKVDRFGRCFPQKQFPLPKTFRRTAEFFRFLKNYKFFFAFENSLHCRDYITEKFFTHSLTAGLLPVVAGATNEDYLAVAPPKSFVHVEDFHSTADLVQYLNYLDGNHTAYAEYFEWRNGDADDYYSSGKTTGFCALCRSLHGISADDPRNYQDIYEAHSGDHVTPAVNQTIESVHRWWRVDESTECIDGIQVRGR